MLVVAKNTNIVKSKNSNFEERLGYIKQFMIKNCK